MIKPLKKMLSLNDVIHRYGFLSTIKIILHYCYFKLKRFQIDLKKEHIVKVNDYKLSTIPNDKGISAELLIFGIHEPIHTKLLSQELRSGMICLDIGANIGYYALLESKLVGENGKVIAIEPSPENFRHLQKNVKLQDNSNIEIHNFACGDTDGITKFSVSDRSNWSRVLAENEKSIPDQIINVVNIPIRKIDSFLNEKSWPKVDLIRMDVEGYEFHVFNGMKTTLGKFKPILVMEFHKPILDEMEGKEFLSKLKNIGYEIKYYFPRDLDMPIVGTIKNVQKLTIDYLLDNWRNPLFSKVFTIFLVPK